jgi:D-aminopeptidase
MSSPKIAVTFDEAKIDAIFAELDQCQLPGAAVGIAINGKPVYRKGFGLANMELPVTLSPAIRMRIYSVSKHFTCFAYMLLCEDGKAGVDDPVGKYFPELSLVTRGITMRQLMGNVSGLRDMHSLNFMFNGSQLVAPSSEVIALYKTIDDVDAEAGTTWIYNNFGFVILAHVIERITGQKLAEVVQQRIFDPIGLHDTMLRHLDTDFAPNSAAMHMTAPEGGYIKFYAGGDRSGTGGIVSTVNDMLRWLAHMDAPRVGNAQTWNLMTTPQILVNGTSTGYGFGLFRESYRGVEMLQHPGSGMGANAQIFKVPAAALDIAIMVNREDVSSRDLGLKIIDACLPELEPADAFFEGPFISGIFRSEVTGRVILLYPLNGEQFAGGCFRDIPFAPDDAGVFRPRKTSVIPAKYAITLIGDRQNPEAIRFSDYGNIDDLMRIAPVNNSDLTSIIGTYRSESIGVEAKISEAGMWIKGHFGSIEYALESLARGVWRAKAASESVSWLGGILCFEETGFRFWCQNTRALPFRLLA